MTIYPQKIARRYRGKWPSREMWISICSMHYKYEESCSLCKAGTWNKIWKMNISRTVYFISPMFWRWYVNKY